MGWWSIETPILSLRAARHFLDQPKRRTTRGAQVAFGKNNIVSPQTLRGRAKTQPPRAGCPRDVMNEWFTTNFGAADELTADYRTPRRRAADSGGAGRTATGIGREKGVERLLLGRGPYLATPTSARNAPSATPGGRARAPLCKWTFFGERDDLAEIAAIKRPSLGPAA